MMSSMSSSVKRRAGSAATRSSSSVRQSWIVPEPVVEAGRVGEQVTDGDLGGERRVGQVGREGFIERQRAFGEQLEGDGGDELASDLAGEEPWVGRHRCAVAAVGEATGDHHWFSAADADGDDSAG